MAAAVARRTPSGAVAGAAERIGFAAALDAYLGSPEDPGSAARRVAAGVPADLVVLRTPLASLGDVPGPCTLSWRLAAHYG
jgi:hypothetical protein